MRDIEIIHKEKLEQFLSKIPEILCMHSWSPELLQIANRECNFPPDYNYILFPDGISSVAREYENWLNIQMLSVLNDTEKHEKIRAKIAKALEIRIIHLMPKAAALNHSSYFMLPINMPAGLAYAGKTCDQIWRFAGDKSTDFNYYTKRGLLLSVYLAATTYYFADDSNDFVKTKEFINSSLDNIINIASLKNRIKLPKIDELPIVRLFL